MAESMQPIKTLLKSGEESKSVDSPANQNANQINLPIAFSEKAIHQRDADENLFLRFLELDPPWDGNSPAPTSSQLPDKDTNIRRMSVKPQLGRTPFTITKRLTKYLEKGFGFSIVWTHPPRVEKVEPGLSASQNSILPGDYVIFVDKHNIVTMPEADVLNLIRAQGNQLTLEIFRRPPTSTAINTTLQQKTPILSELENGVHKLRNASVASSEERSISPTAIKHPVSLGLTTSRYSNISIEPAKKKMQFPQVTFSNESTTPTTDLRKRFLVQLISREQNFVAALQFGMQRFVQPLFERKDLISPNDNKTLFQNIDELMRISEDILDQLVTNFHGEYPHLNFVSRVYLSKTTAICAAYKKYCNGIKRADCVLVNKSRQPNSEFVIFITEPQVRRRRLDLTMLIHRPLQHFREILKLMQLLASHCHVDSEEYKNFTNVINELQSAYREITVGGGLMEPLGEGRPLLTLQDLEARMVFTRCKPFTLAVQGRQWIFGGDLSRVEGRSIKPYWTLLFSDILVFAKVSRDRVLFITEEPLPIANIVDSCFNIRKKTSEFRLTIDPNGRFAESPTAYCGPDLTRTPKKNIRRKVLILRAPSMELKAVWQNLLQRQIFLVNAALGSTPLSSPLESPDVLNTLVSLSDLGATNTSMASIKLTSIDSSNKRNQQQRHSLKANQQVDILIDEKCRILNKTGTSKGSALHLASWMKGQFDKQQEQARLSAMQIDGKTSILEENDEERISFWTKEQLEKRTKELNLAKEMCGTKPMHLHFSGKRFSGVEEVAISDAESELKSLSRSTTSDSQITVRSSPNANLTDKISVCRHCHKNCKQSPILSPKFSNSQSPPLLSNSLKVQHSQASPNRCNQLVNGTISSSRNSLIENPAIHSSISSTSSTITGDFSDDLSKNSTKKEPPAKPLRFVRSKTIQTVPVNTTDSSNDKNTNDVDSSKDDNKNFMQLFDKNKTHSTCKKFIKTIDKIYIPCNCKCRPEDFSNATLSPDEIKQEKCKLISDVKKISNSISGTTFIKKPNKVNQNVENHKICKCVCDKIEEGSTTDDDLSLILIGLAQLNPTAKLITSESIVPSISVVPPTPEAVLTKTSVNIWDNQNYMQRMSAAQNNSEENPFIENLVETPDDSPVDEGPPYYPIKPLRRFGTLSSLEKFDNEATFNGNGNDDTDKGSSEEGDYDTDLSNDNTMKIITREVYDDTNGTTLQNWTSRAGSYVVGKMSFIDKYFGKWNQQNEQDDEKLDECISAATSGDEVWGTPTSGGDNDDLQANSDLTQSSPTKSSSSLLDDDDTELMMDELLMAPPMTNSSLRGLLPRRRLEPLFEEETESDEDRSQQENQELKKGESSTNGHNLEESTGTSSDEEECQIVGTAIMPLLNCGRMKKSQNPPLSIQMQIKQMQIQKRNFLMMKNAGLIPKIIPMRETEIITDQDVQKIDGHVHEKIMTERITQQDWMNMIQQTPTKVLTTTAIATTISNAKNIISMEKPIRGQEFLCQLQEQVKPISNLSPPPPPPRRLHSANASPSNSPQSTNIIRTVEPKKAHKFGDIADIGFSVDSLRSKLLTQCTQDKENVVNQNVASNVKNSIQKLNPNENQCPENNQNQMDLSIASKNNEKDSQSAPAGLSPRLEMRLALNNDIMGDEDLISYNPNPDLITILGHDLSSFHRLSGKDILHRPAMNRIQPKEKIISFYQQRNSKIDTPIVNRKQTQSNQHTLNNSVFANPTFKRDKNYTRSRRNSSCSDDSKLSNLELLAKQEYSLSQSRLDSPSKFATGGSQVTLGSITSVHTISAAIMKRTRFLIKSGSENSDNDDVNFKVKDQDERSKTNRSNSYLSSTTFEYKLTKERSQTSLNDSNGSNTPDRSVSPKKDNDKTSLNRRFWKQLTKRRRVNSITEITAS